jgi:hypothetical protein
LSARAGPFNQRVAFHPLSLDTSPATEGILIDGWRRMTPADKARTVTALTNAAIAMARAGIRHRHPDDTPERQRMRLAEILLGPELARRAFPPGRQ